MPDKKSEKMTLLIIPHTGKGPVSLKVPTNTPHIILAALVVGALFLAVFFHSYNHMSSQVGELENLKEVARAQKAEINYLSNQALRLTKQVEEVQELSNQIREILGMEDEAETGDMDVVGLGGTEQLADRSGYRIGAMELESLHSTLTVKAEELQSLVGAAEEYQHQMDHTPSIWPTQGRITSPFGYRRNPFTRRIQFHYGIDIANSSGTPIVATAGGQVVEASYRSGWGRLIIIDHGYDYVTYYAHLRGYAVSAGDNVSKGEIIGYMGNSGSSTGTHLHYEVHYKGERVDPRDYMN